MDDSQYNWIHNKPFSSEHNKNKGLLQTADPPNGFYYSVLYGESIFSISQAFNISMMDIINANKLMPPYIIYPGQRLFIPYDTPVPPRTGIIYIVQPGDTLFTLAQVFNTSAERIADFNNIHEPDLIYQGQRLIIPIF